MAVRVRTGLKRDYDESKMTQAEIAVAHDTREAFVAFAPGDVHQIATVEILDEKVQEVTDDIIADATDGIGKAIAESKVQTTHAKTQGDYAKAQGDYAKLKGDETKAIMDSAAPIINTNLQATYSDKMKDAVNKFITCPTADDGLVHVKNIVGETIQKVTVQGKNLLPNPIKNSVTLSGITFTFNPLDNTITINGTASNPITLHSLNSLSFFRKITLGDGRYTHSNNLISGTVSSGGTFVATLTNMNNASSGLFDTTVTSLVKSATLVKGEYIYGFYITKDTIVNNVIIKPQLEVGDVKTAYEPFTPNSPSPEYPSPLEYAKDFDVVSCGKNLIPKARSKQTVDGVTFTPNTDGSITLNGTATGIADYRVVYWNTSNPNYGLIWLTSGNKYICSSGSVENATMYVAHVNSSGTNVYNPDGSVITPSHTQYVNSVFIRVKSGVTYNNVTVYPQLELGTVATTYEPYKSDKINISFTFMGLPNGTKNSIELVNGVWNKIERVSEIRYDGSADESYQLQSINSNNIANFKIFLSHKPVLPSALCNILTQDTNGIASTTREGFLLTNGDTLYIRLYASRCSTVEQFRVWLVANNIVLQYELATPIYTPIEPIYLKSWKGTTHLFTNSSPQVTLTADFKSELWSRDFIQDEQLNNAVYMGDDEEVSAPMLRDADLLGGQPKSYFEGLVSTVDGRVTTMTNNLTNKNFTYAHKVNSNHIIDNRGLTRPPSDYVNQSITYEFKTGTELGLPATYYLLETYKPWSDLTAPLQQKAHPLTNDGSSETTEYVRRNIGSTNVWGSWQLHGSLFEDWKNATLLEGWTGSLQYKKNGWGQVRIKGKLNTGTKVSEGTVIAKIPMIYAPSVIVCTPVFKANVLPYDVQLGMYIDPNGFVTIRKPLTDSLPVNATDANIAVNVTYYID